MWWPNRKCTCIMVDLQLKNTYKQIPVLYNDTLFSERIVKEEVLNLFLDRNWEDPLPYK